MEQIKNVLEQNANFININEVSNLIDNVMEECNINDEQRENIKNEAVKLFNENKDLKISTIKHIKPKMGAEKKKSAPNKYILFISDPKSRKDAISTLGGENVSQTEITKELSKMWKVINENKDTKKHHHSYYYLNFHIYSHQFDALPFQINYY